MNLKTFCKKIDEYFEECEARDVFPDEAGMALKLGLERGTLEKWLEDDSKKLEGFRRAILDARLRRESVLVRGIYASEKSTTGKIFLSRQGFAGGLSDKTREDKSTGDLEIEVKITGIGDCFD